VRRKNVLERQAACTCQGLEARTDFFPTRLGMILDLGRYFRPPTRAARALQNSQLSPVLVNTMGTLTLLRHCVGCGPAEAGTYANLWRQYIVCTRPALYLYRYAMG